MANPIFYPQKFTSVDFLEFLCTKLVKQPVPLPDAQLLRLIVDLGNANYKPSNWDEEILPLVEKAQLSNLVEQRENVDWPRVALSLIRLGHNDAKLIERIMRSDLRSRFQQNYRKSFEELKRLSRDDRFLQIEKTLIESIGESKILSAVLTQYDCPISYVLKINRRSGQFTPFADHERKTENPSLDRINCTADELL